MTTLVTDTFARANETPIAAPWAAQNADLCDLDTNHMLADVANSAPLYFYTFAAPNDQFVRMRVTTINTNSALCAILRGNSVNEYYQIVADFTSGGAIGISKINFGFNGIAAQADTWNVGDTFEGRIIGNALSAWHNGVQMLTGTDSTFASGSYGARFVQGGGSLARIDLFEAGDFTASGGIVAVGGAGSFGGGIGAAALGGAS